MNRRIRGLGPAIVTLVLSVSSTLPAQAQSIGDAMVTYLNGKVGARVGGGEASHLASEALRVGGAEFYSGDLGEDSPGNGDKVWGTLVTLIQVTDGTWSDSNSGNPCQPGDVIQFGGNAIISGTTYPANFTAIVKTVNSYKRPGLVFQQNLGGVRTVQTASIHARRLTAGWIRIYRPVTRVDEVGTWKFSVVNNAASSQVYTVMIDVDTVRTVTATAAGTSGSYLVHKITNDTIVPCVVNGDNTIYLETGKSNEIYTGDDGALDLRQIDQ
ncbi:MAG: hypothetical protein JWP89_5670 [Schlesneria sp.]|nr:hypothetical protein [Schlesneria sp.]